MIDKFFKEAYEGLNIAQREAVDIIDGPVMVVAGPGTGKTQVLSLRIANILKKTDTKGDGILCLTFTNAGVHAMRQRLERYIGKEADTVTISTFHSFAINLVEKYFDLLDFPKVPELLSDDKAVFLVDEILHDYEWDYIRSRSNPAVYFNDLKQLISILKRERISHEEFLIEIEKDIKNLKEDPDNISSRGESKGNLKKEIEKKINSLERTREVVEFYRLYEDKKRELSMMDYDDVLEYATKLVENFDDVRDDIRENYLYILIDEHQDSSGIQNGFLKAVWGEVEKPNIFVVGDDRQLIYGFSGASLSYFEEFSNLFGKAKLITLVENYRSTSPILSLADDLLSSSITKDKLRSNKNGEHKISLSEYAYPRDEIIGAGLYFKNKIKEGLDPSDCALLVPRNYHVRLAISILQNLDLPVSAGKNISLFEARETESMRRILGIIVSPTNSTLITESILDKLSGIETLKAHTFLKNTKPNNITIDELVSFNQDDNNLFTNEDSIVKWGNKLKSWVNELSCEKLSFIIGTIGNDLLINNSKNNDELVHNVEVVRSFIHLATLFEERNKNPKLKDFLNYIDRLESYNAHVELAPLCNQGGIEIMTLHKSKGLEYKAVWIAHMNEEVLMSQKKGSFVLPDKIKEHINKRDIENAKRELYVAITRAKDFCNISCALSNYNGGEMEMAHIIKELPDLHFIKNSKEDTEKEIILNGPAVYVVQGQSLHNEKEIESIKNLVKDNYTDRKVSVSLLNNFFDCPWRWYFRNFLQVPEVKGVSLAFGSVIHSIIEYILNQKVLPSGIDITNKIMSELGKEGIDDIAEVKKMVKDAEKIIKNWIKNYYDDLAKNFKSEKSLSYKDKKFPHLNIYGKIDLIEYLPDNFIRVTDFKTGQSKTKGVIEKESEDGRMSSYLRQLAMYSYLVSGENKNQEVSESCLLFLEDDSKNSIYRTHIDQEQIDLLVRDIEDYDQMLKTGDWVNLPCHFKPYGKETECPYCSLRDRII